MNVKDRPTRIIGRSMSETDTIKAKWVESSSKADEIWVPTEFHRYVPPLFFLFLFCFVLF